MSVKAVRISTCRVDGKVTCGLADGKVTCRGVPIILDSARKHGVSDEDMKHAIRNATRTEEQDEGFVMFIGPGRNAMLLEVGVVDGDDGPVIVHADKARPKYRPGRRGR
jgi:hypothetical protein